jgi:hypothetical protein
MVASGSDMLMTGSMVGKLRHLLAAQLRCYGAAGMKTASRWRIDRRWHIAMQHDALRLVVWIRYRDR